MRNTFLLFLFLNFSSLAHASDLSTFFGAKAGHWDLISGWAKSINSDGSSSGESTTTYHHIQVTESSAGQWNVYEDFCAVSDDTPMCGQSLLDYQIEGENLYLLENLSGSRTPVRINRVTPTELDMSFTMDAWTFLVSETISRAGIYTRTTRVQLNGNLVEVKSV